MNGVARPQTDKDGRNLAAALRRWHQRPMLAIQCSAHKLQLVASDSWSDEYLKELEKVISSIFKRMSKHPASSIDNRFWSDITEEPMLSSLSQGKMRWLSLLKPMRKLLSCFATVLAHLHYHFMHHSDREQKKTLRWAFLTLASWKAKVVMSGMVDIMEQCWETKAQLEAERLSLDQVAHAVAVLKARLQSYVEA